MKNQFKLEISNPCSENFNDFTPTKAGGFCGSCQKEVIDFTGMSSQEIINYFKENSEKSTCGRFADYQLGSYTETEHKSKNYSFWKGLGLACLSLFTFNTIQAQEVPKTEISTVKNKSNTTLQQEKIIVKGTVTDETGPLPYVNIFLEGTSVGTVTNYEGKFEFPKPLKTGDVLMFSFVGLESKKVVIDNKNTKAITLNIKMKTDSCILLGKVAVKKVYSSKKQK